MRALITNGMSVYKNFVQTVRAVEYSLRIPNSFPGFNSDNTGTPANVTEAFEMTARSSSLGSEIQQVLRDAIPFIADIPSELNVNINFGQNGLGSRLSSQSPLIAKYVLNSESVSARRVDHHGFLQLYGC